MVGTADHGIPPTEQPAMATRAGARIAKVDAGHLPLITRPAVLTDAILDAARAADRT